MARMTVVVPTAARPETLELTLRAISAQSARAEIASVLVSENLSDERSLEVCRGFPMLPIRHVVQDPQLTPHAHAAWLLGQSDTEFVAFVCDDDLWSPGHLATGMDALDRNPEASAFFSAFVGAESELADSGFFWAAGTIWLAAGRPVRLTEYILDLAAVLALSWVFTPFQYSTLVARSSAAAAAAPTLAASSHQFYSDRVLCLALAKEGKVVYSPFIDTLYRAYEGNWTQGHKRAYLRGLLVKCEAEVWEQATDMGLDLAAEWRSILCLMPDEIAPEVGRWFRDRFEPEELVRYGFAPLLPATRRRGALGDSLRVLGRAARMVFGDRF